jgi:transposase
MSETASSTDIIIGVDTHKLTHAVVAISALGARLGSLTIPANSRGYQALQAWARSLGVIRAFGIEGTGSYGAGLSRFLCEHDHPVFEVPPQSPNAAPKG